MKPTRLLVAGAAAVALLLAACGEDKSDVPTSTSAAPATTVATTTTAVTVALLKPGDSCSVYGAAQKVGDRTLYCDGETWGTDVPPSTTAAPSGP